MASPATFISAIRAAAVPGRAESASCSTEIGKVRVSGGANYTWLGDADPTTGPPYVRRARFTDNSALSFGLRVGYEF